MAAMLAEALAQQQAAVAAAVLGIAAAAGEDQVPARPARCAALLERRFMSRLSLLDRFVDRPPPDIYASTDPHYIFRTPGAVE